MKAAKVNLPASLPVGRANREFLCSGRQITLSDHGRISVASFGPTGFQAGAGDTVVVVGTGLWYELWQQEDWLENREASSGQE